MLAEFLKAAKKPRFIDIQLERVKPKPCANPRSNTETRYRVLFHGKAIGVWRDPECSAARYLVDQRIVARKDILRAYHGDKLCLSGGVGWFADHIVVETPSLRVARWRPHPFAA
jgi:hypothetical protein